MCKRLLKLEILPTLFEDNTSAIKQAKSTESTALKHLVKLHLHYIRQEVQRKLIDIVWIPTDKQLGDFFTKALGPVKFLEFREKLTSTRDTLNLKN